MFTESIKIFHRGHSQKFYEKEAIEQWIIDKGTSPINFQNLTNRNIVPSNLHKKKVMEFREHRLNKAMFYVELMIEEKSLGITLEQLLTVAEDDSRVLRRETELIRALKRFNHIRKMELFRGSFTKDMEKLFETLVKFKKYPQAIDIGKELAHRYETEKNIPPGKWESMLKQLILITDDSEQKKLYKNKLYALYLKENNWKALQTTLVEHMSLLVEDKNKRELVNAGINELMFVFKLQFQQLKEEILKEVNEGLEGKVS